MAINYLRSTYAKKSRGKSTAARDSADYVLRDGKFKNLIEENQDGLKNPFSKIEDGEKIVQVSEAVPHDWEKNSKKFGSQFRAFSKDADNLERSNSQTLQRLVLALPRELADQNAQQTYIKDFMKQTGLDQQPHLAVMHIDPKNHNPHAHILFSARPLNFKCPKKNDGSTDLKAFFSRQNPKNQTFGSGDLKQGRAWTKQAMVVNQNLIRTIPGLGQWQPQRDGQKEHHQGRTRGNDNYKNIVDHNQEIRASRASANVVKNQENDIATLANTKSPKELSQDLEKAKKDLAAIAAMKSDKSPKIRDQAKATERELQSKIAQLEAASARHKANRDKKQHSKMQQPDHHGQDHKTILNNATLSKSHDYSRDLDKNASLKDNQDQRNKANNNRLNQDDQRTAQQVDAQRDAQAQQTKQQQDGTAREADNLFNQMAKTYGAEETKQARQRFDAMPPSQQASLLNDLPTKPEKMKGERAGDFMNAINYKHEAAQEQAQGFITSAEKMKQLKPTPGWKKFATPPRR